MKNSMRMFGVSLCALLILLLRGLSLYLAETSPIFSSVMDWQEYLLQSLLMILSGLLLVYAYRKLRCEEKDFFFFLSIFGALLLAWGGMALQYSSWKVILQQLLLAALPLFLTPWARFLRRKLPMHFGVPIYYAVVAMLCWLLLEVLAPSPLLRWEIVSLLYILVLSFLVWNNCRRSLRQNLKSYGFKWLRKEERVKRILLCWLPPVIALLLILCFHDRVQFILMTLTRPVTLGTEPWEVNWVGNRLLMMFYGWQGDLSLMEVHCLSHLPDSAPLLWLSHCLTPFAAILMVGLLVLMLRLLHNIGRSTTYRPMSLSGVLVSAFTLQTVLGLAAELSLNTSTLLGPVFLRSPACCWLLPLAAAADVYQPTLAELIADQIQEKLLGLVKKLSGSKKGKEITFSPEFTEFPRWTGSMTLEGVFPEDTPTYYGEVPLRWVSQECSADGTPLAVRYPEPKVTVYESFPIKAAGKTYHHLNQLTSGDGSAEHFFRRFDMYGREVLHVSQGFPAFDEFDAMYDDRRHHWYYLREDNRLTCIQCSDEGDEIVVTEDVDRIDAERWGFFERTQYFP